MSRELVSEKEGVRKVCYGGSECAHVCDPFFSKE